MNFVKTLIFSFDRPAQLELLLTSIEQFDTSKVLFVTVQYAFSNEDFHSGYKILIGRFPNVIFINENRFKTKKIINPLFGAWVFNLIYWLRNRRFRYSISDFRSILLKSLNDVNYEYYMFLTDDCLFYREIHINNSLLKKISEHSDVAYSLTLGKNIIDGNFDISHNHINWSFNRKKPKDIWNYPFSAEGRIYNRKIIYKLLNRIAFTNPNTLETIMVVYNRYSHAFKIMTANLHSCLVGFELNRVQNTYLNNNLGIDNGKINDYYLGGYKIFIDFDFLEVNKFRPDIQSVYMQNGNNKIDLIIKNP